MESSDVQDQIVSDSAAGQPAAEGRRKRRTCRGGTMQRLRSWRHRQSREQQARLTQEEERLTQKVNALQGFPPEELQGIRDVLEEVRDLRANSEAEFQRTKRCARALRNRALRRSRARQNLAAVEAPSPIALNPMAAPFEPAPHLTQSPTMPPGESAHAAAARVRLEMTAVGGGDGEDKDESDDALSVDFIMSRTPIYRRGIRSVSDPASAAFLCGTDALAQFRLDALEGDVSQPAETSSLPPKRPPFSRATRSDTAIAKLEPASETDQEPATLHMAAGGLVFAVGSLLKWHLEWQRTLQARMSQRSHPEAEGSLAAATPQETFSPTVSGSSPNTAIVDMPISSPQCVFGCIPTPSRIPIRTRSSSASVKSLPALRQISPETSPQNPSQPRPGAPSG